MPITENGNWVEEVYQIETSDPVLGGPDGPANAGITDLANRTRFLYTRMVETGIEGQAKEIASGLNNLREPGFYAVTAAAADAAAVPTGEERGHMIITGRDDSADGGASPVAIQMIFIRTGEVYYRQLSGGSWGSWIEFATSLTIARLNPMPPGSVMAFAGAVAPTGFFLCQGQAVSRADYADLYAVIGDTYGPGDGSTTFNLPDLRGEFIRGFDDGKGVDAGRVLGSAQGDELGSHTHNFDDVRAGTPVEFVTTAGSGNEAFPNDAATVATESAGGAETRPRNVAMNYIIRF